MILFKTRVAVNEFTTKNARRVNALSNENCPSSVALLVKLKTTLSQDYYAQVKYAIV